MTQPATDPPKFKKHDRSGATTEDFDTDKSMMDEEIYEATHTKMKNKMNIAEKQVNIDKGIGKPDKEINEKEKELMNMPALKNQA